MPLGTLSADENLLFDAEVRCYVDSFLSALLMHLLLAKLI